jgi:uncharacterized protein
MVAWLFGPRRGMADSPWSPAGAVALVLVTSVLAAAFAGVVMAGLVAATPWLRLAVETRSASPDGAPLVTVLLIGLSLAYFFLVAGLMMACGLKRTATLRNSLLLRSAHWRLWQYAVFALLTVVTLVALQQLLFYFAALLGAEAVDPMRDLRQLTELFRIDVPVTLIVLAVLAVVAAPLAEEFVFRGMLFAAFKKTRLGVAGSAVILSALWAVLHWGYSSQSLIALFGIGLLFAYIVWRTGSLWPAVVGHAANNLVAVAVLMGLQAQG